MSGIVVLLDVLVLLPAVSLPYLVVLEAVTLLGALALLLMLLQKVHWC